jgi:hypothetical protein
MDSGPIVTQVARRRIYSKRACHSTALPIAPPAIAIRHKVHRDKIDVSTIHRTLSGLRRIIPKAFLTSPIGAD